MHPTSQMRIIAHSYSTGNTTSLLPVPPTLPRTCSIHHLCHCENRMGSYEGEKPPKWNVGRKA